MYYFICLLDYTKWNIENQIFITEKSNDKSKNYIILYYITLVSCDIIVKTLQEMKILMVNPTQEAITQVMYVHF